MGVKDGGADDDEGRAGVSDVEGPAGAMVPFPMTASRSEGEAEGGGTVDDDTVDVEALSMVVISDAALGVAFAAGESAALTVVDSSDSTFLTMRLWHSSGAGSKSWGQR